MMVCPLAPFVFTRVLRVHVWLPREMCCIKKKSCCHGFGNPVRQLFLFFNEGGDSEWLFNYLL